MSEILWLVLEVRGFCVTRNTEHGAGECREPSLAEELEISLPVRILEFEGVSRDCHCMGQVPLSPCIQGDSDQKEWCCSAGTACSWGECKRIVKLEAAGVLEFPSLVLHLLA